MIYNRYNGTAKEVHIQAIKNKTKDLRNHNR